MTVMEEVMSFSTVITQWGSGVSPGSTNGSAALQPVRAIRSKRPTTTLPERMENLEFLTGNVIFFIVSDNYNVVVFYDFVRSVLLYRLQYDRVLRRTEVGIGEISTK